MTYIILHVLKPENFGHTYTAVKPAPIIIRITSTPIIPKGFIVPICNSFFLLAAPGLTHPYPVSGNERSAFCHYTLVGIS